MIGISLTTEQNRAAPPDVRRWIEREVMASFGQPNIEALPLLDIAHHTRLPDAPQVVACLDIINQAFSNACGDVTSSDASQAAPGRQSLAGKDAAT